MKYLLIILLFIGCNDKPAKDTTTAGTNNKPSIVTTDTISVAKKPVDTSSVWPDNRAIGMVMLSNFVTWTGTDNWMNGETPFDEWLLSHANNCIAGLKSINAQGLIVWDPEGTKFPRAYTYYGDPALSPEKVNPFFSAIKAAGFRVGVCLRPDQIIMTYNPTTSVDWAGMFTPEHYVVPFPLQNLVSKVEYARQRWGCTLFYVDSNVGTGLDNWSKNTIGSGGLMPSLVFDELRRIFPDCLFIPEHSNINYLSSTMPYYHKGNGLPNAGKYVIDCGDTQEGVGNLKKAVNDGNILMGRVWYEAPELDKIKKAYK